MTDQEVMVLTNLIRELGIGFCRFAIADASAAEKIVRADGDRERANALLGSASAWDAAASRTRELVQIIESTLLTDSSDAN